MVDKNRNGIDDKYEVGLQPINTAADALAAYEKKNRLKKGTMVDPRAVGSGGYSGWDSATIAQRQMADRTPKVSDLLGGGILNMAAQGPAPSPVGDTPLPSFMDFLKQVSSMSQGGFGQVNYDPQRNDARRRAGEYDARLQAMYNQLTNSIRGDAAGIKQNYQGAIDDSASRTADTQQAIQGASNAADDRNLEVLRNLGIEEAQGNIIAGGRDLNSQTAGAVAEAAARGQISGDALSRNQQAALTHNTNLAGASGLEGNLQRSRVQSELASLLAQYDMQEQEANRQAQQQSQSQNMGLANALYEDAWRQRNYNDDVSKWLFEQQNQPQPVDRAGLGLNFVTQLQQQFPDLDISDIVKLVQGIGTAGKLYG